MAMSYTSALITGAQIVSHTFVQDLSNVAADSELTTNQAALEGHQFVYRFLEAAGIDPTQLTNQDRLKSAVGYAAVWKLAVAGSYDPLGDREASARMFKECLDAELAAYKPETAEDDVPHLDVGMPAVGNFEPGYTFADSGRNQSTDRYYDDLPGRL